MHTFRIIYQTTHGEVNDWIKPEDRTRVVDLNLERAMKMMDLSNMNQVTYTTPDDVGFITIIKHKQGE